MKELSAKYLARPRFKQTEVGQIPEDWAVKQVGELDPFVTSGSRGWAAFYSDRGSPFIRITNLSRACIYLDLQDLRFVNLTADDSEAARTQLRDGDVLISITADIGMVGYVTEKLPKPAYINQHVALVRFDSTRTNSLFVSYFLASEKPQKLFRALTDSGAKAGMNLTTVRQIRIALPPIRAEQDAIACALSDADALIESLEQLLDKKRQIKQGAMQELLTGKKRLPGFSGKWEEKRLGEVATATKGSQLSSSLMVEHGRFGHLNGGISPSGYTNKSNTLGDTIAISEGGNSCGYVQFMTEPYWCGGHCYSVIPSGIDNRFLYHALKGGEPSIMGLRVGSGLPNVQKTALLAFKLRCPEENKEQVAIAAILSDMDSEIALLQVKLAKAREIKQGMMQELLSGRIRLV